MGVPKPPYLSEYERQTKKPKNHRIVQDEHNAELTQNKKAAEELDITLEQLMELEAGER